MKHTLTCPVCQQPFYPDAQHRFGGKCSAICARKDTPHTNIQRTVGGEADIVLTTPINRKHGADNRKASNE